MCCINNNNEIKKEIIVETFVNIYTPLLPMNLQIK